MTSKYRSCYTTRFMSFLVCGSLFFFFFFFSLCACIFSQVLFENDLIQSCLVACCLEITISLNRLPCDFPLLLQILKLAPYHFWRVCFSSKLVSNQVCVNCLQVPQVNQPQINSVRSS